MKPILVMEPRSRRRLQRRTTGNDNDLKCVIPALVTDNINLAERIRIYSRLHDRSTVPPKFRAGWVGRLSPPVEWKF